MSKISEQHLPVKPVINCLYREERFFKLVKKRFEERYGAIEDELPALPFDFSDYYEEEMGRDLKKAMFSIKELAAPESLIELKHFATELETEFATKEGDPERRPINIDPGHIYLERFLLATGKNVARRIYLGKGVYADLTLIYIGNSYVPLPWTYKDYLHPDVLAFAERVRETYRGQLKPLRKAVTDKKNTHKEK